ncbi:Ca2 :cation antiporter [Globisporangium polare]
MDVLEARELQLRKQLFGASDAATSSNSSITRKISDLNTRLEHLYSAVAGFSRLGDLYNGVQRELELQPSSTLGSSASKGGEEIKRAVILSSEDRIDEVVLEFRKLREMQTVLAQLEQLRSRNPVDESQLAALERSTDAQTQRALALHARVERLLTIYHEMISFFHHCLLFDLHVCV